MEKSPKLQPIAQDRDDQGISLEWVRELDRKCTKWLRERNLYWDSDRWRDEMRKRWNAERIANEHDKLDGMVDDISRE